jgi:hypothetical protein
VTSESYVEVSTKAVNSTQLLCGASVPSEAQRRCKALQGEDQRLNY